MNKLEELRWSQVPFHYIFKKVHKGQCVHFQGIFPLLERGPVFSTGKQTGSHKKVVSFVKWGKSVSSPLKLEKDNTPREITLISKYLPSFSECQLLKERICTTWEWILSFLGSFLWEVIRSSLIRVYTVCHSTKYFKKQLHKSSI